jgi:hypothetical protein
MEYEIEDDALLFDESTNPSLEPEHRRAIDNPSALKPKDRPADKRRLQKAEVIPEEEPA